ncbi:hypothetical protein H5410_002304 [Solanum commersonii]|uniref:Uncharacterized protein n=1 Tax=Solanum commersonii TaxID=4109 RepID=A0A9J6B1Y8_SOLCO|nr:hypothetical protein H5410_002304 [Solanum commersonii]
MMHRQKHFNFIALLEPFQHHRHIDMYKLWLDMGTTYHNALSKWSRDTYGDIFKQIAILEEIVQVHEQEFETHPTGINGERLQKVQADLIKFYAIEEKFWKQKAGMQWFEDGDGNTKLFHVHVNGKKKKLNLQRIQDNREAWLDIEEDITQEAIRFYTDQNQDKYLCMEEDDQEYDQTVILVKEVYEAGQWNEHALRNLLPQKLVEDILNPVNPPKEEEEVDIPYWRPDLTGRFTVSSSFPHQTETGSE